MSEAAQQQQEGEVPGIPPPEAKPLPMNSSTDGISSLDYLPLSTSSSSTNLLASTSWDGTLRIHDTKSMSLQVSQSMDSGPLLSLSCLSSSSSADNKIVVGGMDGSIKLFDVATSSTTLIGRHEKSAAAANTDVKTACSCLGSFSNNDGGSSGSNLVVSAGWDRQFHLWDPRVGAAGSSSENNNKPVSSVDLPGKAFSMDCDPNNQRVVVATSGRRLCFIDIRYQQQQSQQAAEAEIVLDRESSLKFATRCARFFPDGNGIAIGSIEGRVAVEYLEELGLSSNGRKKYAFKCHRANDRVYPVNAIAFHPVHGTFATGGCDGTVVLWDGYHKKKLTTLQPFPTSVAALAFDSSGSEIAVASSYTYEEGEREHNPRDEIYVRQILDSECRPKTTTK